MKSVSVALLDSELENAREAVTGDPADPRKNMLLAEAVLKRGKIEHTRAFPWHGADDESSETFFREAIHIADNELRTDSLSDWAWVIRGLALTYLSGHLDVFDNFHETDSIGAKNIDRFKNAIAAENALRRAIELNPAAGRAYTGLGLLFAVRPVKDHSEFVRNGKTSVGLLGKAALLDPKDGMAHWLSYFIQGRAFRFDSSEPADTVIEQIMDQTLEHFLQFNRLAVDDAEAYILCEWPSAEGYLAWRLKPLSPLLRSLKAFLIFPGLGIEMFSVKRDELGLRQLHRSLDVFPDYPYGLLSLANRLYKKGATDKALEVYRRGRLSRPDPIAEIATHWPIFDEEFFRMVVRKYPSEAYPHFDLGYVLSYNLFDTVKVNEAISSYEKGLSIDPANGQALVSMARVVSLGLHKPVTEIVRQALKTDLRARDYVTLSYSVNDPTLSQKIIEQGISVGKISKGMGYNELSEIYYGQDYAKAEAFLRMSTQSDPTLKPTNDIGIARMRLQNKRYHEAIQYAEAVLNSPYVGENIQQNVHYILGDSYKAIGQYKKALDHYQKTNWSFLDHSIAEVYEKLGNTKEALRYYERDAYYGNSLSAKAVERLKRSERRLAE